MFVTVTMVAFVMNVMEFSRKVDINYRYVKFVANHLGVYNLNKKTETTGRYLMYRLFFRTPLYLGFCIISVDII